MNKIFFDFYSSFPKNITFEDISDNRTRGWTLVDSYQNVFGLVILYLVIVAILPKLMTNRKQFQLKQPLIVYNLTIALGNIYIFKELLISSRNLDYNYFCQPCRVTYTRNELRMASAVWLFYISKLIEFADTLFFILRKKNDQLSFLHVYHHSTMFPLWWIAVKWIPTGSTMINAWIHFVMYTYYALSAMGPRVRQFLWWKKYLTLLQMAQFVFGFIWALQALCRSCDFPTWISCVSLAYMTSFLILFVLLQCEKGKAMKEFPKRQPMKDIEKMFEV